MTSLEPNLERVKERRKEVMRAALRARNFTEQELTEEASNFMKFALSLLQTKILDEQEDDKWLTLFQKVWKV